MLVFGSDLYSPWWFAVFHVFSVCLIGDVITSSQSKTLQYARHALQKRPKQRYSLCSSNVRIYDNTKISSSQVLPKPRHSKELELDVAVAEGI